VTIDENRKKSTNPYCPSVRFMPPDDVPFIVEGSKEFPARRRTPQLNSQVKQGIAGNLT
jgi:hypothetical protein